MMTAQNTRAGGLKFITEPERSGHRFVRVDAWLDRGFGTVRVRGSHRFIKKLTKTGGDTKESFVSFERFVLFVVNVMSPTAQTNPFPIKKPHVDDGLIPSTCDRKRLDWPMPEWRHASRSNHLKSRI
jgi:hypothetical protein